MSDSCANLDLFSGLVVYYLDDKLFCVNIDDVFAIVNPADYPKNFSHSYLINSNVEIENVAISVIDLYSLFKLKRHKITSTSRIISLEIEGHAIGLLVDKVEEVITLNPGMRNDFKFIEYKNEKFLAGKVKYHDAVFYLPNFKKIVNESIDHY